MWRALLLAVVCSGCQRAAAGPDASTAPPPAPDAGGWLSPSALDAWLHYQRALAALPPFGRGDGGPVIAREEVRLRARADEALRVDAGLRPDEVDRIEALVAAVVTERTLARLRAGDGLAPFQEALSGLGAEQRAKAEAALTALESSGPASLNQVEARFGSDAVRLVLTREDEVTKTWEALLDSRGDVR